MKEKRKGRKSIEWREHIVRDLKWTWPYLVFVFLIFIFLFYALTDFSVVVYSLLIIFILILTMVGYSILLAIKTVKRAKRLSFVNYKKILILLIMCSIGLFFILIMGSFLVPNYHTPILIFELLIAGFLLGSIINARYHGSEKDWYNNIVVRYGQDIASVQDGYTDRPYSMKLLDPSKIKNWNGILENYGIRMTNQILIAGYERIDKGFIFYLPSPKLMSGIIGPKRDVEKATRITTYGDGNISVYISKDDYDRIGLEITYHELCQRVLLAFADSLKAYIKGDEKRATETLGGEGYAERRKKSFRQRSFFYTRIAVVLTIINILMTIGIFSYEFIEYDDNFTNGPHIWTDEWGIPLSAHHPFFGRISQGDLMEGDELLVSFTSNMTLPQVYIVGWDTDGYFPNIESDVLRNVSSGELHIKAKKDYYDYRLVIDLKKGENISQQTLIPASIDIKVKHINAYSPFNTWVVLLLISFYVPFEFALRRKYKAY